MKSTIFVLCTMLLILIIIIKVTVTKKDIQYIKYYSKQGEKIVVLVRSKNVRILMSKSGFEDDKVLIKAKYYQIDSWAGCRCEACHH
jgi:hypothetical protein